MYIKVVGKFRTKKPKRSFFFKKSEVFFSTRKLCRGLLQIFLLRRVWLHFYMHIVKCQKWFHGSNVLAMPICTKTSQIIHIKKSFKAKFNHYFRLQLGILGRKFKSEFGVKISKYLLQTVTKGYTSLGKGRDKRLDLSTY